MYYLRTKSAVNAIQFTVSKKKNKQGAEEEKPLTGEELKAMLIAAQQNPDDCDMCGS